jgi:aspartyl-tRNA(Asn)/glutamyl-tRNA(Gln) amidotransferase subunit A
MQELWMQPIETLAPEMQAGQLTPSELVETVLDRIEALDGKLSSYIVLAPDARAQAQAATREIAAGKWRGPLHGVPIAIKDNYTTHDMPTTVGSRAPGLAFPLEDSACAQRLRGAGAILIGKTRTHEFAWGNVTPPVRNPWDLQRIPGGSSGGSGAALAAGLCVAAMGSDTGGSIRIPASLCGTVGMKATFGRVSRYGVVPHSWSLDHAGPLTRTVTDTAHLLNVLAGYDARDPACADRPVPDYTAKLGVPIKGMRIGVCLNHFFERNQHDVERAVDSALGELSQQGAIIREFRMPNLQYGLGAIFAIELASSTAYHDVSLRAGRTRYFQPDVRTLVEMGRLVTAADYLKAEQLRRILMDDYRAVFEQVDVLLSPTTPLTAWRVGEDNIKIGAADESVLAASWRLTYPYNLAGLPAISLPCGFDRKGLPIGLQIAAQPFDEASVLQVAHAYERNHDWWRRFPAL